MFVRYYTELPLPYEQVRDGAVDPPPEEWLPKLAADAEASTGRLLLEVGLKFAGLDLRQRGRVELSHWLATSSGGESIHIPPGPQLSFRVSSLRLTPSSRLRRLDRSEPSSALAPSTSPRWDGSAGGWIASSSTESPKPPPRTSSTPPPAVCRNAAPSPTRASSDHDGGRTGRGRVPSPQRQKIARISPSPKPSRLRGGASRETRPGSPSRCGRSGPRHRLRAAPASAGAGQAPAVRRSGSVAAR